MKTTYLAVGLMTAALAGLWYAGGGSAPQPVQARETATIAATTPEPDNILVSSAVSHENLTVFFLRGPDVVDSSKVVTLQEVLEKGWAVIEETGNVNQLTVENTSADFELFLQSGDMIKGGRQDRMIASDMLVPPKSGVVPFASHCVEQGRWSGRAGEAATHFSKSDNFAVGNDLKFANVSRNQSAVWANVKKNQEELSAKLKVEVTANPSPTSLQLTLENEAVQKKVAGFEQALKSAGEQRRRVVGAVFVVNGQVRSAEVYGSNGLFRKAWPKLLKSATVEAVAANGPAGATAVAMTAESVEAFLVAANQPAPPLGRNRTHNGGMRSLEEEAHILTLNDPGLDSNLETAVNVERVDVQTADSKVTEDSIASSRGSNSIEYIPVPAMPSPQDRRSAQFGANVNPAVSQQPRIGRVIIHGNEVTGDRAIVNQNVQARMAGELIQTEGTRTSGNSNALINLQSNQFNTWQMGFREDFVQTEGVRVQQTEGSRVQVNAIDNSQSLQLEARDAKRNNAVIHRSILKK